MHVQHRYNDILPSFQVEIDRSTSEVLYPITNYTVMWIDEGLYRPITSYFFRNLQYYTTYEVVIRAQNDVGWSLPTTVVFSTPYG